MAVLKHMVTEWRHASWQRRGEQCLVDTFWPTDYRIGTTLWHHGHCYHITRYDRVPGSRLCSVWGKPVTYVTDSIQPDPRIKRLIRTPSAH
jgi:hypothetical protein